MHLIASHQAPEVAATVMLQQKMNTARYLAAPSQAHLASVDVDVVGDHGDAELPPSRAVWLSWWAKLRPLSCYYTQLLLVSSSLLGTGKSASQRLQRH
jgi:hypothetical protein